MHRRHKMLRAYLHPWRRAPLRPEPIRESLATAVRSSVQRSEFAQGAEQAAHLFQRVVMHQADAQHSAILFYLKALRQIECVVVAVPCEDALPGEKFGNHLRRMIPDAE